MIVKSVEILNRLVGEGNWITIAGLDYDTIVLQDGVSMPSREEFDRVKTEVDQLAASLEYQSLRAKEYPDFNDYLDGIVKGDQAQIQSYIDACQAIKNKYPKP
ncbi:hypothetical protein EB001_25255 [bacterium]|nr:hypothetical protein [bacterium]